MKPSLSLIKGTRLATLKALIAHLLNVLKADNRMGAENLALVFGPNIMWKRDNDEQVTGLTGRHMGSKLLITLNNDLQIMIIYPGFSSSPRAWKR